MTPTDRIAARSAELEREVLYAGCSRDLIRRQLAEAYGDVAKGQQRIMELDISGQPSHVAFLDCLKIESRLRRLRGELREANRILAEKVRAYALFCGAAAEMQGYPPGGGPQIEAHLL